MTEYISILQSEVLRGFDFSNYQRNKLLFDKNNSNYSSQITYKKTGTTICGVVCGNQGVVLGTDTRSTAGGVVADKDCDKLHHIYNNIYAAGAGTSADLDHTTRWVSSRITLEALNYKTQPRVKNVVTVLASRLFRYQGHIGCALIVGGMDCNGPSLYQIAPNGAVHCGMFMSMGSGSLSAIAVLEDGYKPDMTIEEGMALVTKAVRSGIMNDMGSGSNVNLCSITADGLKMTKHVKEYSVTRLREPTPIIFERGTTRIIKQYEEQFVNDAVEDVEMTEA